MHESALGTSDVPRPSSPCDGSGNETMSDTRLPKIDFRYSITENRFLKIDFRYSITVNRFQKIDYRKSISENRFQKIDYWKSISENRFQILDYRKSIFRNRFSVNRVSVFDIQISISDNRISSILRCFEFCRNRRSILVDVPYPHRRGNDHRPRLMVPSVNLGVNLWGLGFLLSAWYSNYSLDPPSAELPVCLYLCLPSGLYPTGESTVGPSHYLFSQINFQCCVNLITYLYWVHTLSLKPLTKVEVCNISPRYINSLRHSLQWRP